MGRAGERNGISGVQEGFQMRDSCALPLQSRSVERSRPWSSSSSSSSSDSGVCSACVVDWLCLLAVSGFVVCDMLMLQVRVFVDVNCVECFWRWLREILLRLVVGALGLLEKKLSTCSANTLKNKLTLKWN